MTKETKIGLLVGLAFIILFAIILSEKGTPQRSAALPSFSVADGSKTNAPLTGTGQPLGGAGRLPITQQLPPIVQPKPQSITMTPPKPVIMTEEPVAQVEPKREEPIPALPTSVVDLLNNIPIKEEPVASAEPTPAASEALAKPIVTIPPTIASAAQSDPATVERATMSGTPTQFSDGSLAARETKPIEKPVVIRTVHTVQAGESLGKIAAKYYGRSTPARVDALFKANRDQLKDTHQIKAQQKLDIPDLGEANSQFEPVAAMTLTNPGETRINPKSSETIRIPIPISDPSITTDIASRRRSISNDAAPTIQTVSTTPSQRKNKSAEASYQIYEVRPKDTLSKIAKRLLGSEKHSAELYRLNKDHMANKDTLKPGMKLRIPLKSVAVDEPQTAISSTGFGDAD